MDLAEALSGKIDAKFDELLSTITGKVKATEKNGSRVNRGEPVA